MSGRKVWAYAIRRLNPFLGVLQVVETAQARASSANGLVWDIQLVGEKPSGWGALSASEGERSWYRYALWSRAEGLVSRPLLPDLDNDEQSGVCADLVDALEEALPSMPFDLADREELWLFDASGELPLALLASVLPGQSHPEPEPRYWCGCLGAEGVPSQRRFPKIDELESGIRRFAGFNWVKRWVLRDEHGGGRALCGDGIWSAGQFPGTLLSRTIADQATADLVEDYLSWIAPSLLTLPSLSDAERDQFELTLSRQAGSVEHHYLLYPRVLDPQRVAAARVQGRMLASVPVVGDR